MNENSLDLSLVQQYLKDSGSALPIHLYEKLQLVYPVTEQKFTPRDVALLFFQPKPREFFMGVSTEIAIFTHDNEAKEEVRVTGPIDQFEFYSGHSKERVVLCHGCLS